MIMKTQHQNLQDADKAVSRGEFIVLKRSYYKQKT